eukprot:TRINITY_DN3773_c0_g1_i1.p1 TRINITY_DN3773_c0_g1~~TRINITY_DN3773_c0_g1_i1.p1  ORF type:complete len:135 (-),score=3.12 TRINITY_DN3773_c0_g1_i1:2-406(-)
MNDQFLNALRAKRLAIKGIPGMRNIVSRKWLRFAAVMKAEEETPYKFSWLTRKLREWLVYSLDRELSFLHEGSTNLSSDELRSFQIRCDASIFSELRVKNKKDRTDSTRWTTVFPSYSVVDTGRSSETAKAHRG